jgi:teichoic acid glycerol-phosphate primase
MRSAAFNTGSDFHLLDHIAPLAELLQMPLITTEELNTTLAKRYYPQVEVRYMPDLEFRLGEIATEFDTLFECKYWQPHLKTLFRQLFKKEMRLVFCPHGQSDKGYRTPLLAPYREQDMVLIYGTLMIDMLKELKIPIPEYVVVGNYRLDFYLKHRIFYDQLAFQTIPIDRSKRTLLYAPTWCDADGASSFFTNGVQVIDQLPSDWNLIIKLHPLLEQRNPAEFYSLSGIADKKSNLFLVHEFPPVYPILSMADIYLGDHSSVGYDYLSFNRPLCFLPTEAPGRLHTSGPILDLSQNIYSQLDNLNPVKDNTSLYQYAFGA